MSGFSVLEVDSIRNQADEHHDCGSFHETDDHENYGPVISDIVRIGDTWYATDNGEYSTPIKYCPFCGKNLPGAEWESLNIQP